MKTPVRLCAPACGLWSAKNNSTKPSLPRYGRLSMRATPAASPKATCSAASVSRSNFPCPANRGQVSIFALRGGDLLSIADYALREWGQTQSPRYIDEVEVCYRCSHSLLHRNLEGGELFSNPVFRTFCCLSRRLLLAANWQIVIGLLMTASGCGGGSGGGGNQPPPPASACPFPVPAWIPPSRLGPQIHPGFQPARQ
jgi:hypothetical protein